MYFIIQCARYAKLISFNISINYNKNIIILPTLNKRKLKGRDLTLPGFKLISELTSEPRLLTAATQQVHF